MTLSEEARERLADVVRLQPTKNAELEERWGLDSGSDVHHYLEDELGDYYYRDDNSLIRATDEAAELVDVKPGVESNRDGETTVRGPPLQAAILAVLPDADERSASVVSVLHALQEEGRDPPVDDVRSGLRSLVNKGVVETEKRAVPTFRLALDRDDLTVEEREDPDESAQTRASGDAAIFDELEADFEEVPEGT